MKTIMLRDISKLIEKHLNDEELFFIDIFDLDDKFLVRLPHERNDREILGISNNKPFDSIYCSIKYQYENIMLVYQAHMSNGEYSIVLNFGRVAVRLKYTSIKGQKWLERLYNQNEKK